MELAPIFKKAYWTLAASGLVYVLFVFSLTFPDVQRAAVYVNKINPARFHDVNDVESYGFLKHQVQPFNLTTPDEETLYAWHMLPLHLCLEQEAALVEDPPSGPASNITQTAAFNLLASNPRARVVLSFHGNAAHLGSVLRPEFYRSILATSTPEDPVHVISFDYRGFGLSTGSPTEEGLITDGLTLINYLTSGPLSIAPSRITLVGHSLGTAVATAVTERLASIDSAPDGLDPVLGNLEPFAGVILLAPFTNIPSLIKSYSIKGLVPPLLSPLVGYPKVQKYVLNHVVDTWDTAARVARLTGVSPSPNHSETEKSPEDLNLVIIHARDDFEIPWREGNGVWDSAVGGSNSSDHGKIVYERNSEDGMTDIKVWEKEVVSASGEKKFKRVRWERAPYGGHNRVAIYSAAAVAVLRTFE
ncbi:Monoacylglycerol lipase abhd12 [Arachnomyces sp. PD_36]|nr:Monoacylglycerol lipase abhd12 [Arachnomyces sp. PD_36]